MRDPLPVILQKHLPAFAVAYCRQLWLETPFDFRLRKSRHTKLGDFTAPLTGQPRITVNADCHPYLFMITYVHEVAHLRVHLHAGRTARAHGPHWKRVFQNLMRPLLIPSEFPAELFQVLSRHMMNPKASSHSDAALTQVLRQLDERTRNVRTLKDLSEGEQFTFRERTYIKMKTKRTRALCKAVRSGHLYLVPLDAVISSGYQSPSAPNQTLSAA